MRSRFTLPAALIAATIAASWLIAADNPTKSSPPAPPASKYAPVDDLLGQVELYLQHIDETLANKAEFDDGAKSRLKKDANTLAVLFNLLDQHDSDNRFQGNRKTKGLAIVALEIANATDFDAANATLSELKKRISQAGPFGTGGPGPESKPSLEQLMKQVTTVNGALKRGMAAAKFESQKAQSAGQSATLAAIADAIVSDPHAVKNPADTDKWYKFSAEMRDSAGAVNTAVHAGDQAATPTAMSRLAKSCEACHAVFRKEKD